MLKIKCQSSGLLLFRRAPTGTWHYHISCDVCSRGKHVANLIGAHCGVWYCYPKSKKTSGGDQVVQIVASGANVLPPPVISILPHLNVRTVLPEVLCLCSAINRGCVRIILTLLEMLRINHNKTGHIYAHLVVIWLNNRQTGDCFNYWLRRGCIA